MNQLVTDHPAAVVIVISFLWGLLSAQGLLIFWFTRRELSRIQDKELEQDRRLNAIEGDQRTEDKDIVQVSTTLKDHVEAEEEIWETIREVSRSVQAIQRQLPNGDLRTIIVQLGHIDNKVDKLTTVVTRHNEEAEEWKRRIVRNEMRLSGLGKS